MIQIETKKNIGGEVWERKWIFLPVFFLVFFLSLSLLTLLGAIPESFIDDSSEGEVSTATETQTTPPPSGESREESPKNPTRLVIEKVGINSPIQNPESREISELDKALLSGVVRYPGTGRLDEDGTMFIFGHSSYLPVVYNKAYQSLNYLQKLEKGDLINVESDTRVYLYRVASVTKENATDTKVDLTRKDRHLVIATCDSFGKKQDRYVVDAEYVGSYAK